MLVFMYRRMYACIQPCILMYVCVDMYIIYLCVRLKSISITMCVYRITEALLKADSHLHILGKDG